MRYREEDEIRLKKTVDKFNRKVRKLEKAGQVAPEKISLREERKYVTESRQDYNREIRRLERFQREAAAKPITFPQYGVTVTHWEAVETARQIQINNRKRAKLKAEFDTVDVKSKGKQVLGDDGKPLKRAQMQGPMTNALNPKIVDMKKTYSKKAFAELQKSVKKEAQKNYWDKRTVQWQKNYIKALNLAFPGKEGAKLRKQIKSMTPAEFEKVMRSDQDANIAFQYNASTHKFEMIESKELLKTLNAIWLPAAEDIEKIPKKNTNQ